MKKNCWLCNETIKLYYEGTMVICGNKSFIYYGECSAKHPNEYHIIHTRKKYKLEHKLKTKMSDNK